MKLPSGYDNPESEFFVPISLRARYEELEPVLPSETDCVVEKYAKLQALRLARVQEPHSDYWRALEEVQGFYNYPKALHFHYLEQSAFSCARASD